MADNGGPGAGTLALGALALVALWLLSRGAGIGGAGSGGVGGEGDGHGGGGPATRGPITVTVLGPPAAGTAEPYLLDPPGKPASLGVVVIAAGTAESVRVRVPGDAREGDRSALLAALSGLPVRVLVER